MIDTHAHIYLEEFDADKREMISRALDAGINKIFLPNIDSSSVERMLSLCETEKICYPMMGLHPCSVGENFQSELDHVFSGFDNPSYHFYGVGECGLDYYWDKTFIPQQKEAFLAQIRLAKKYRLPIIIHSRDAVDDCIEMIAQEKDENLKGIFHCFSGTLQQLEKIIGLDFYAGIGGVVTFKNGGLDKILQPGHLSHIVLETDSPYLAPVPFRGKRNEPSYLKYILQRLSEITALPADDIERMTNANAELCFSSSS